MDKKIRFGDTTSLYDNKAELYLARANYSSEAIDYIIKKLNITENTTVVDVGSGTGILAGQISDKVECNIYVVEPNEDMMKVAKRRLVSPKYVFLKTTAENTGIEDNSVEAVVVGTALHWFDTKQFKNECRRICKKGAKVAVLRLYNFVPDIDQSNTSQMHSIANFDDYLKDLFCENEYDKKIFFHEETFDETRFINERLSDHKAPNYGDKYYPKFIEDAKNAFAYFKAPVINNVFVTVCFVGEL